MPRKGPATKREPAPDPVYQNPMVSQFINRIMLRGKKSLAEKVVYGALKIVSEKTGGDPTQTLRKAVENVRPLVEVRSRRVGGATYQVPVEVRSARQAALAMRWNVDAGRKRAEKSMIHKLAGELVDGAESKGPGVRKR